MVTGCARRQRRGPGAPAAGPEEERCAVERRSDLSYSEFVQQYVRPLELAASPSAPHPPQSPERRCRALLCRAVLLGLPRPA